MMMKMMNISVVVSFKKKKMNKFFRARYEFIDDCFPDSNRFQVALDGGFKTVTNSFGKK